MVGSTTGRLIEIGPLLLLLSIAAVLVSAEDYNEDDTRFDRTAMSAVTAATEAERRFHLEQLNNLEQASPALTKPLTLQFLQRVQNTCKNLKRVDPVPDGYCSYFYDSFSCWRPAAVGNYSTKTCPKYILGMHTPGVTISILCKVDEETNSSKPSWDYVSTNETHFLQLYGYCFEAPSASGTSIPQTPEQLLQAKLGEILRKSQVVGPICYTISLVALAVASLIFLVFKRLHCPRNFIHLHLFLAFMLRALMCLLQYYLFNNGQSMQIDGDVLDEKEGKFSKPGPHWECKLIIAMWNYSLVASFFWLLVEGLYLHNVVYFFVFRETGITGYAIFGWVAPMLVIAPWIAVKVAIEDHLCWVAYLNLNYFWILRGPIMATIIINFLLFINMIRELFLKLKDSHITETRRYRKLAKSSVLLVVILGVYYFIISIPMLLLDTDRLTWPLLVCLSVEHIFGSLQGLMVALVYCFMNSEVRSVVRKRWYRWILLRQVSSGTYSTSNVGGAGSGGVHSRQGSAANTLMTSLLMGKEDDDLPSRIRRSLLFRRKSNALSSKGRAKRAESCSPASGTPNWQRCAVGGDLCPNCRYTDLLRLNTTPCSSSNRSFDTNGSSARRGLINCDNGGSTPTHRSQSIGGEPKTPSHNGHRETSIRTRQLQRRADAGDTIALLRMRSPHSFDMQELSKGARRPSKDDVEPTILLPPPNSARDVRALRAAGVKDANRRYSLNTSVVSYFPVSTLTQKTSTTSRCTAPMVKGCWQRQSTDAFL